MFKTIKNSIFTESNKIRETNGYLRQIDIDKLEPMMPPVEINEKEIINLANSICKNGVLSPIPVYTDGTTYKYIAGSRRIAASMLLGRKSIICHLYTSLEICDKLLISSIMYERKPNTFKLYDLLCFFQNNRQLSVSEASEKLGITFSRANDLMKLECFTFDERRKLNQTSLTEDAIIELAKLTDKTTRSAVIDKIYEETFQKSKIIRNTVRQIRGERHNKKHAGDKLIDNTFYGLIKQIKLIGKSPVFNKQETDTETKYTVKIPKD